MNITNEMDLQVIKQALREMPDNAQRDDCKLSAPVNIMRKNLLNRLKDVPDLY